MQFITVISFPTVQQSINININIKSIKNIKTKGGTVQIFGNNFNKSKFYSERY